MSFDTIEQAIADLRNGKLVVVADDADRENEGDLICAAQHATPDLVNFMILHGRGLLCLALTPERCEQLELPQQVDRNADEHCTAFTVTIDADRRFGVTTGISAVDRATTIRVAINPETRPGDLRRANRRGRSLPASGRTWDRGKPSGDPGASWDRPRDGTACAGHPATSSAR